MIKGQEVTILGAGISGLAVAIALAQTGARVRILEQAPAIREVGAGMQISPNGFCVLRALGLEHPVTSQSMAAQAVELINGETGAKVSRLELDRSTNRGEFRFVHRADLIGLLEEAARAAGVEILLGQKVGAVSVDAGKAALALPGRTEVPDLLIGADGLHSVVRRCLNGASQPFFTGQVAWRATLPLQGDAEPVARVFMGQGRHLVTYPLRGGQYRNIVAVEERQKWVEESWSLTDDPLALRIGFEDFVPEVRGWLEQIERPNLWGLFRHEVAQHWHGARMVLVGDAAHPTLPFLAQGANLALEDAWVLARSLATMSVPDAFVAYQTARQARVVRAVAAANANARNYHLGGFSRTVAHAGIRLIDRVAPDAMLNRFRWLYGFDVTAAT